MESKLILNKKQIKKAKLPSTASAVIFDRDKNLTYLPQDESVEPPEHISRQQDHNEKEKAKSN